MRTHASIAELSPFILPEESAVVRNIPRPPEFRQPDYMDRFDFRTIFYDVFYYKNHIMLIGPPLFNFKKALKGGEFWLDGNPLEPDAVAAHDLDKTSRTCVVANSPDHKKIQFRAAAPYKNDLNASIKIRGNQSHIFTDKKVLLVLSKDNPLRWIRDLIKFYITFHGIDAVLLYDNASNAYSNEELLATISNIEGITAAVVVPFNVKWGVPGWEEKIYDSNFAQTSALEHARFCFLDTCAGVIYTDVDELVVPHKNITLFDAMKITRYPAIKYESYTFHMVNIEKKDELHYSDFKYYHDPKVLPPSASGYRPPPIMRWAAIPKCIPFDVQFCVHCFHGYSMLDVSNYFKIRHFLPMTVLERKKSRLKCVCYDPNIHRLDSDLLRAIKIMNW